MFKNNSVEYFFLLESLKRLRDDMLVLNKNISTMSFEECYEMMCHIEGIKEGIEQFEVHAKDKVSKI